MNDRGLQEQFDPGFGKSFAWDIDLLGGYAFEFLDTRKGATVDGFWGLRLKRGFQRILCQMNAKVVWIQGWQVAAYWQAVVEARYAGCQIWLRGDTNARSNMGGSIGRRFKRQLLRRLLARVDRLLCVGVANRQFYLEQGIEERRLASAPHCVDNARFAAAATATRNQRDRIREQWRIPAEAFCFLFAGKFVAKKRPFDLVEATRRLEPSLQGRKVHLLWVGTGELGQQLRQGCHVCFNKEPGEYTSFADEGHGPNASFVGFLNQSEISKAYVAADCMVLPSDAKETWGLVVNEAMASGLPCIVTDACGCAEDLVEPIRPDLCYPVGDITSLERAMAAAITDTPSRLLLAAQISKYDITQTLDTVESLYLEALRSTVISGSQVPIA